MAIDEHLCISVRAALASQGAAVHRELKMFGGIGFMLNGNFIAGASSRGLLVRVGKNQQAKALTRSGARPMVMRDRVMEGYVYVDPEALSPRAVKSWMRLALTYVRTLPSKQSTSTRPARQQQTRRRR